LFDIIVVGSGPAGVFSSIGLTGLKILMLDVGLINKFIFNDEDLPHKKLDFSSNFKFHIGKNYHSLEKIFNPELNIKLNSPAFEFITHRSKELCPIQENNFNATLSFAKGGLMNAWGGVSYKYEDQDLKDFPFNYNEIKEYYEKAENIADTSTISEKSKNINPLIKTLYSKYKSHTYYFDKRGVIIKKLPILNDSQNNKSNYNSFFHNQHSIYTTNITLDSLIEKKILLYKNNLMVTKFVETDNHVNVYTSHIDTGEEKVFSAKKLILAAGCLGTSKIVLNSFNDYSTKLPLQANETSYTPFLNPFFIGKNDTNNFSTLSHGLISNQHNCHNTICTSFHTINNIAISDLIMEIPFPIRNNLFISKLLKPSLLISQIFYPSVISNKNWIKIERNQKLKINYETHTKAQFEKTLITYLRKTGFFSHIKLSKKQMPGSSFHYSSTLPMKKQPAQYQTDPYGKLFNTENVYVSDSANFSYLPAKNLTLTIMANALRITDKIKKQFNNI